MGSPASPRSTGDSGLATPEQQVPVATVVDARPAAIIDGRVVQWGELRPVLNELAGAAALQDVVLDRAVTRELSQAGIVISEPEIAAERRLLVETLDSDPNTALRLLDELRARRGLGPYRFDMLLRRNAGLRALVGSRVTITDDAVGRMHELVHGPRRQARIIVVPTIEDAQDVVRELRAGRSFGDLAVQRSVDASASRGGLLEPIARTNPAYPEALLSVLWTLTPGQWSSPVLMNRQYAIVMLEQETPGTGTPLNVNDPELRRLVRVNQERLLMDELARKLLDRTSVSVFDDELAESWRRRAR